MHPCACVWHLSTQALLLHRSAHEEAGLVSRTDLNRAPVAKLHATRDHCSTVFLHPCVAGKQRQVLL